MKNSIKLIKQEENGCYFNVEAVVPMNYGFIEDMHINFVAEGKYHTHKLKFDRCENGLVYFKSDVFLETKAIYRYFFDYKVNGYFKETRDDSFKLSVNYDTPEWAKGEMMYHIFVDRFNKGRKEDLKPMERRVIHKSWDEEMIVGPDKDGIWNNDFYGGDLKGIEDKLEYIKSLGVNILYLSPIVASQSNHRYDTSDYENVDPYAGSNEDLKSLCDKAHSMGMKIVLDAVFNHTGNDSKYFNQYNSFKELGAFQSKESPYYDFYKKYENNGKTYFDYWWGMVNLPVCNGHSKHWQNYIYGEGGVIDKWFSLGIDGLRLDVADDLTDEFIEGIRRAVKRNKEDGFILGEVWKNPMRMNRSYIESGKGMDSVMNYTLVDAMILYFKHGNKEKLSYIINDILREYPKGTIDTLMNFTSTHDISRAINIFGCNDLGGEWAWDLNNNDRQYQKNYKLTKKDYERAKELYMAYTYALANMPGILSIFYGDEIGMEGLGNLANRKTFTWDKIDYELLNFFKGLGEVKSKLKFLKDADLKVLDINKDYIMFERYKGDEKVLVVVNRTGEYKTFKVPGKYNEVIHNLKNAEKGLLTPYGAVSMQKVKSWK